jgi:hypothetical protein
VAFEISGPAACFSDCDVFHFESSGGSLLTLSVVENPSLLVVHLSIGPPHSVMVR